MEFVSSRNWLQMESAWKDSAISSWWRPDLFDLSDDYQDVPDLLDDDSNVQIDGLDDLSISNDNHDLEKLQAEDSSMKKKKEKEERNK